MCHHIQGDSSVTVAQREEEGTERGELGENETKQLLPDYFHPLKQWLSPWLHIAVTWGALKNTDAGDLPPNRWEGWGLSFRIKIKNLPQ